MSWPVLPLAELTSKIGSGATPRGGANVYLPEGTLLIRSQNVLDNRLKLDSAARIDVEAAQLLASVTVRTGDVLINITGDSIARVAEVTGDIGPARVNQHVAIVRPNRSLNPTFLQKCLVSPSMKARLIAISQSGATRKALTKAHLRALAVPVPPLPVQDAIAEVLGALDDKIAVNSKLAHTLNDLASEHFGQVVPSAGEGPTYGEVANVYGGGTPSTKVDHYWGGEIRWATPTDVTALEAPYLEDTTRHVTDAGLAACASELHPAESILMTSRATIGAFALAGAPTAVNQGFIVVRPKDPRLDMWLFHEMRSRVSDYLAVANGATFLELSRGRFKAMSVRWSAEDRMLEFGAMARPLHQRARAAMQECQSLAQLRDTLLPELMSGRLRVRDAERAVEDAL